MLTEFPLEQTLRIPGTSSEEAINHRIIFILKFFAISFKSRDTLHFFNKK